MSDKYDWNHLRIVPFNPTHDSNVEISVEWSKVSNAAIKKKKKNKDHRVRS